MNARPAYPASHSVLEHPFRLSGFMLRITENDIRAEIPPGYLARGRAYFAAGQVSRLKIDEAGRRITASVAGTASNPYRVDIAIEHRRGRTRFDGACSCPVGYNCKHVAATLLAALSQTETPAPTPPQASPAPISDALRDWLGSIEHILPAPAAAVAVPADECLLYLLKLDRQRRVRAWVNVVFARRLPGGGYGKAERWNGGLVSHARYVTETDRDILRWLDAMRRDQPSGFGGYALAGTAGAHTVARMIATGRCHWRGKDAPPLTAGDPRRGTPRWRVDDQGRQHMAVENAGEIDAVLPLSPLWYVDKERAQAGELAIGLPDLLAATLYAAPVLAPDDAPQARAVLRRHFNEDSPALPRIFGEPRVERPAPVPVLRLFSRPLALDYRYQGRYDEHRLDIPLADLRFDYAGRTTEAQTPETSLTRLEGDTLVRVERDFGREARALARLQSHGFEPLDEAPMYGPPPKHCRNALTMSVDDPSRRLLDFSLRVVPQLRAEGWRVEIDPSFPYRIAEAGSDWYADLDADETHADWFGLALGVNVEGERVNLLPLIIQWLEENRHAGQAARAGEDVVPARLPDGRLLAIPYPRVRQVLAVLTELYGSPALDERGRLKLARAGAAQLAALADDFGAGLKWSGAETLQELARRLRAFTGVAPAAEPRGLRARLRGYQREGLGWLQFLREYGFAGVLADDMGLGKTVQTLALLLAEQHAGRLDRPTLVVAPTSVLPNWRRECERFAPRLRVLTLHGAGRSRDFAKLAGYDLVLTSYALLARDAARLKEQAYHYVILDEAQTVKNPRAQAAQAARALDTRHRLCLTGTPLENHLGELWSLFHFLMPGWLGDEHSFRRLYRTPIEKHADTERSAALARRLKPFLLRRTKEQVASELPAKNEIVHTIALEGAQRDLYESIRVAMHDKVRGEIEKHGLARSHIMILDALLKLRQICCHPRLLKLEAAKKVRQSAKLDHLLHILPELIEEGRRVLLFSQFTSMLALIEPELAKRGIDYAQLTGDTRDRAAPVERFQSGAVPLFLISLKAGGTGLNLTAADTVIHYDPWWNPAVERQATDRAHRIGQHKTVFVYKLITQGTVEEKIAELQARKQALADGIYGKADARGPAFTAEDLALLFSA